MDGRRSLSEKKNKPALQILVSHGAADSSPAFLAVNRVFPDGLHDAPDGAVEMVT